jgi:hypothetical protein
MKNQPISSIPVLYISLSPPNRVSKSELYRTTNAFLWKLSHFTDTHLYLPLRQGQHTGNKHEHLAVAVTPDEVERFWKRYSRFIPSSAWEHAVVSNGQTTNLEVRLYDPELGVGLSEYIGAHPHHTPEEHAVGVTCPRHYNRCDEEYCRHDRANPRPQPASNRRKGDTK